MPPHCADLHLVDAPGYIACHVIVVVVHQEQLYALQCKQVIPAIGIQLQQAKLSLLQ